MVFSLVTNHGYWLVWFLTNLECEAYEWYMDHVEGHFRDMEQLKREILYEFRPEVGHSTALRALASMRHGREENILVHIRKCDLVCTRFVNTMLNDDTLKQFFIHKFIKSGTIIGVLEMIPRTLADAKAAAWEVEELNRDYERFWKREVELIPQFIPVRPRAVEGKTVTHGSQALYASLEANPRALASRDLVSLLALLTPSVDLHMEEVEMRLGASQLGFQEAMIEQMQSLTDQMSLMIRSQQHDLSLHVESGEHASGPSLKPTCLRSKKLWIIP